jgi:CHAD domain-containing protein
VAKPREIEGLSADGSYGEAAARIVSTRAAEVTEHARGVLDTGEIEGVHAMRVATRRLRAALEIFEPCFPRKPHRRALREVKRLADGLGERRDRDVWIASLQAFDDQMPAAARVGVESLVQALRDEQTRANLELAPLVEEERLMALEESLRELAGTARGADDEAAAEQA